MRSPSRIVSFASLAAASLALAVVACQAPAADEGDTSEGQLTSNVRKGDEFVRCWTTSDGNADEFFRTYDLKCRVSSAGLPGLAGSSVYVDARSVGNNVRSGRPGETPDQDVLIGRVSKSDFPLKIRVYGSWGATRTDTLSSYRIDVPATEANTAAAPVIVKLPFDMWPVTFLNRLPLAVVSSERYDVQVAPFITEQDERSTKTTFSSSKSSEVMRNTPRFDLDFVAPKSGGITVSIQGARTPIRGNIAAPGTYVIEESGLRLATAAEEAAAASTTPAADGGAAPSTPTPAADGGTDAAPAPPATTCGGPGQTHCTASNGSWTCNDGTRVDNAGTCVACGDDGETYCFDDPRNITGNWKCNAGTRLESSTNKCVACGTAGKTHCFADPRNISGNWVCNPGLRLDSNGNCVP